MEPPAGNPDRYALIGHPVAHSRSPLIHQLFARATHQSLTYELIDAAADEFESAVHRFITAGGKGMNVTVPHKEAAFALSDRLGDQAAAAHAVNTLTFSDGSIRGDNTDGIGFIRDVTVNCDAVIEDARVLVLGAGGSARGILGPLLAEAPALLVLANRTLERAERLGRDLGVTGEVTICRFEDLGAYGVFDIVVNATSAGLAGERPPFPPSVVGDASFCYDLVYSVNSTPFVDWAKVHGARRAVQGWGMLVEQAAESFTIWRGVRPETAEILTRMRRS